MTGELGAAFTTAGAASTLTEIANFLRDSRLEKIMASQLLTLYVDSQFVSPYAMSVFVSLLEKKLAFEIESVDLAANANHEPAFAATSITWRVPTLIHDSFALSESSAISEYIDDTFPGARLYPADPRCRARARQVQAWLRSDLAPIRDERPTIVVFYEAKMPALSAAARGSAEKAVFRRKRLARRRARTPVRRLVHSGRRSGNDAEPAHRPR